MVFQNEIKQGGTEFTTYTVGDVRKADIALNKKVREALEDGTLHKGPLSIYRTISALDLPRRIHQIIEFDIGYDGIRLLTNKVEMIGDDGVPYYETVS